MEIVYSRDGLADYLRREAAREAARSSSTASSRTPSRSTSTRCATATEVVDRRDHAARRGGGRALRRLRLRAAAALARRGDARADPRATREIALAIGVVGLLNVQYAVHAGELYVIEANPRASRTVPFVSKAVGVPLAKLACRIMLGERIADARAARGRQARLRRARLASRRRCCRSIASRAPTRCSGPEMRSTGEVMGIARDFPTAFAKAQAAAGVPLPSEGTAFITVDRHRQGRARSRSPRSCTTTAFRSSRRAAPRRRSRAWAYR